jgi:hypothetical protein
VFTTKRHQVFVVTTIAPDARKYVFQQSVLQAVFRLVAEHDPHAVIQAPGE